MPWSPDGPQGFESRKIRPFIAPYTRGRGLDLGCGIEKALPHMIGMDSGATYGPHCADIVGDIRDLSLFADGSMDFVFSSHALEDIEDTRAAVTEWWRVIKPGGCLVLYLPHKDFYPNIGQPGANPAHKHDFLPDDILEHMKAVAEASGTGCRVLEDEVRSKGNEYSFFQVYAKTPKDNGWEYTPWRPHPRSTLVIRYGGWGDGAVVTSVLPLLKEKGRHITLNTTPRMFIAVQGSPHIDAYWIQDTDQIPNAWLGEYWTGLATRFEEVINLSGSVEDSLLPAPHNVAHGWSLFARRKILGTVNYYERTHDICGVRHEFKPQFYPLPEEAEWAAKEKTSLGRPAVMIVIRGSSVHKIWPHMDALVALFMKFTNAQVVLAGNEECKAAEMGWQAEPRVWCRSGVWTVRQTLAFARQCEIVVGPETGVLNFMSAEPMRKVVFLSHSSHENLTKHWRNTVALVPDVSCHPCHQLHYSHQFCPKHDLLHSAICAAAIPADAAFKAATEPSFEGAKAVAAPLWRATPELAAQVKAQADGLTMRAAAQATVRAAAE